MIHVYRIPKKRSDGYCFGGGVPITFQNVDWIGDPEDGHTVDELRDFLMGKLYVMNSPPGTRFLVLCDKGPEWTFQMVAQ